MVSLTSEDALEAERILCSRSLSYFIRRAWRHIIPDEFQHNWHIDAIAEHLTAIDDGDMSRLLINVPPGSSKSTIAGVMYPAWLWGPRGKPWHKYIGAAHEQNLAIRDNRMMRELLTSSWYQKLWPIKLKGDQNEKMYYENDSRGFRQACAVGSMTGRRGHTIAWDDPINPEKAHSETERAKAIRILTETVPTRLSDPKTSAIVVIMQRLHEDDPSGYILANDLGYDHLCIPMEYEKGQNSTTSIGWTDPRSSDGELMFPDRFDQSVIDRDKAAMGSYAWAGQMQQRPTPVGGGIFKESWWGYYDAMPDLVWRSVYADTAQKTKEQNDYSVLECWGKTKTGQAVLIDLIRGKWEAPELQTQTRAFWNKQKADKRCAGSLRAMKVEDKVSGTGLIQTLKREGIPMIPVQRNTDKVVRAFDAAPFIESGNVLLPTNAAFLSDFLTEVSAFSANMSHKFDDQVDPMMDAVTDILSGSHYNIMGAL